MRKVFKKASFSVEFLQPDRVVTAKAGPKNMQMGARDNRDGVHLKVVNLPDRGENVGF